MIAGIDGQHRWYPPGSGDVAVVLNQQYNESTGDPIWPWFKVKRIPGLYSLGDPQDVRDNRVGADGEIPRLGRRRGKTVVYEGVIKARTRRELIEGRDALCAAFADVTREGVMVASWHPDNLDFDDLEPRYFRARALTCEVIDEQTTTRHERPFVVSLRLSDANFYIVGDDELDGP